MSIYIIVVIKSSFKLSQRKSKKTSDSISHVPEALSFTCILSHPFLLIYVFV